MTSCELKNTLNKSVNLPELPPWILSYLGRDNLTGSSSLLWLFNFATQRSNLMRLLSVDMFCYRYCSNDLYVIKVNWLASSKKNVSNFSCSFSIRSSSCKEVMSSSNMASMLFHSRDKNYNGSMAWTVKGGSKFPNLHFFQVLCLE